MPRATRAAAALKQKLDVEPTLVQGSGGVFKVEVDGQVVAQRSMRGFPTEEEIVASVQKAMGS